MLFEETHRFFKCCKTMNLGSFIYHCNDISKHWGTILWPFSSCTLGVLWASSSSCVVEIKV